MPLQRQRDQIGERLFPFFRFDRPEQRIAAERMSDFDVEKVGNVDGLAGKKQTIPHGRSRNGLQDELDDGGRVSDDHLRSRP